MFMNIFFNFTTLIAFIYLISQFFIFMSKFKLKNINIKVCYGVAGGLLAILLMITSIRVADQIIFDFRHLTILVVAIIGGFSSSLITGIIIFVFRLFYIGVTMDSFVVSSNMLIVAIGCGVVSTLKIKRWIKWIYMNIISLIMISISFYTRIPSKESAINTIVVFWISSIIVGYIVYFITGYIIASEKLYRKFKHEAEYDFLTGLRNVRNFNLIIDEIINSNYKKLSILFMDIDFFKKVNDAYGHDGGDEILKESGKIFCNLLRNTDMIFRVGGEEFVVLLPNCGSIKAVEIAERVRSTYENHEFNINNNNKIKITISIGVASFPETTNDIKDIVRQADRALYKAKENGRNRIEVI